MKQETMKKQKRQKALRIFFGCLCSLLFIFGLMLCLSALWYVRHYGDTGFDSVVFTLLSEQKGVHSELVSSYLKESLLPGVLCSGGLLFLLFFVFAKVPGLKKIRLWCKNLLLVLLAFVLIYVAGTKVNLFGYIEKIVKDSTLYEEYYVEPSSDIITFPEQKRNVVMIILESMEITYLSEEEGGAFEVSAIPELTRIAENNINFSHTNGVGGFMTPSGTGWTVAGMVSQSSGVPLKGSSGALANNEYGKEAFLPGVISLSDVLHEAGYKQALVLGSPASYANRDVYYKGHNTDYIYDYPAAIEEGYIPEDYYAWWGMEDMYLYDYAKGKMLELARGDEPFAMTILTADTHFPEGYVCELCREQFGEQYNNVIACASRQLDRFLRWMQAQSFYENTTVVITGDHLSMDYQYFERNVAPTYNRRIYNCFVNSAVSTEYDKQRAFTSVDIFPTTLAAMGCEIKGERLGLGTNLFSGKQTLTEEMGFEEFDKQILYGSSFYIKNFLIQ